jgi:site-specific DNA-methyltransferase (adenine-specific)
MLLRGEVIWQKAKGAGGSCAWGSYMSPQNPVLRDITERIVVASKGRFDRAVKRGDREQRNLPFEATIEAEEFLEATLDVWTIAPESARKIGHPAPFPVALPKRLIDLYTYRSDLVLDPFIGSGTTAIAAIESGRHYVGFDTDASYLALARERISSVDQ